MSNEWIRAGNRSQTRRADGRREGQASGRGFIWFSFFIVIIIIRLIRQACACARAKRQRRTLSGPRNVPRVTNIHIFLYDRHMYMTMYIGISSLVHGVYYILYNIRRATTHGVSHHQSEREILDYIYRRHRRVDLSLISSIHVLFATLGKLYIIYTTKLCKAQTATQRRVIFGLFSFFRPNWHHICIYYIYP